MTHVDISLKLEAAFKAIGVACERENFQHKPTQEIEKCLMWLSADNRLSKDDFGFWRESCDFGDDDLKTAIDTYGINRFEDLIKMLSNLKIAE